MDWTIILTLISICIMILGGVFSRILAIVGYYIHEQRERDIERIEALELNYDKIDAKLDSVHDDVLILKKEIEGIKQYEKNH